MAVLTVADQTSTASASASFAYRKALLNATKDPDNWHKLADCRPALRDAVDALTGETVLMRTWGHWLVDRLTPAGELHRADIALIVRKSPVSRRSAYRYLAILTQAGIIERHGTAIKRRGEWHRTATIRATARFRDADQRKRERKPVTCDSANSGTIPTLVVNSSSGSVGDLTTDRRLAYESPISDQERDAVDNDWWHLARARSDLPSQRPGYLNDDDIELRIALIRYTDQLIAEGQT